MAFIPRKYSPEETAKRIRSWCDRREHTHQEAREKLTGWGVPQNEREELIAGLIERGFLQEKRYARAFATDKSRFYQWGQRKIAAGLRLKGVSERNIEDALKSIPAEDSRQILNALVEKGMTRYKGFKGPILKAKLARYILSKGFSSEETWAAIESQFTR